MRKPTEGRSLEILTLFKLEGKRVFERIKYRAPEYINIFANKRTRGHYKDVFDNRYKNARIEELKFCGQEVIVALDKFFSTVDDIYWYLMCTEDMPTTISDHLEKKIRDLEVEWQNLELYIDAELGVSEEQSVKNVSNEEDFVIENHESTEGGSSFDGSDNI